jgi:hypothetical protein
MGTRSSSCLGSFFLVSGLGAVSVMIFKNNSNYIDRN